MINFRTFLLKSSIKSKWVTSRNLIKPWNVGWLSKMQSFITIGLSRKSNSFHIFILTISKNSPQCYLMKRKIIFFRWEKSQLEKTWKNKTFLQWGWWFWRFVCSSHTFLRRFTTYRHAGKNKSICQVQKSKWSTVFTNKIWQLSSITQPYKSTSFRWKLGTVKDLRSSSKQWSLAAALMKRRNSVSQIQKIIRSATNK